MKYLPTYKHKLYFYDTLTFWVIRLIMLVLKLKNDLLLLMKNFKIIFLFIFGTNYFQSFKQQNSNRKKSYSSILLIHVFLNVW